MPFDNKLAPSGLSEIPVMVSLWPEYVRKTFPGAVSPFRRSHCWTQLSSPAVKSALTQRLQKLSAEHQSPVSLIGWSLGGVFVREMARHQPQLVRRVFTLGSPINGRPDANNMLALFRVANRGKPVNLDWEGFRKRCTPPPVPCVAIYSKSDGIVAWQCSMEDAAPNTECAEVRGSHFGLVVNRQVLRVIAERLHCA